MNLILMALLLASGPATSTPADALVERVRDYLEAHHHDPEAAKRFYAPDSRIWFGSREGPGKLRKLDGKGPWADWDEFFNSESEPRSFERKGRTVSVVLIEINDFYRLIERQPSPVRLTYEFDDDDRVTGTLVQSVDDGEEKADRFDEAKAWIEAHHPGVTEELMPGGELNPSLDRARRWKVLLNEWREAVGLERID